MARAAASGFVSTLRAAGKLRHRAEALEKLRPSWALTRFARASLHDAAFEHLGESSSKAPVQVRLAPRFSTLDLAVESIAFRLARFYFPLSSPDVSGRRGAFGANRSPSADLSRPQARSFSAAKRRSPAFKPLARISQITTSLKLGIFLEDADAYASGSTPTSVAFLCSPSAETRNRGQR